LKNNKIIQVKILKANMEKNINSKPYEVKISKEGLLKIGSAGGYLIIQKLQPAGKKVMDSKSFISGNYIKKVLF